ncbi:MAG: hypothetical protein HY538_02840 [Deltaproteobacteria bacterium]|nr:hypothetical protein [Deltaproteobacteria bacterium]
MIKKIWANLFLAFFLFLHLLRKPLRWFRRKGWLASNASRSDAGWRDQDFLRYYAEDHLRSLAPADREWWPQASSCVHCGLCTLVSPGGQGRLFAFDPRSLVLAESRSSTEFWAVAGIDTASIRRAEEICPWDVPFSKMVTLVKNLGK